MLKQIDTAHSIFLYGMVNVRFSPSIFTSLLSFNGFYGADRLQLDEKKMDSSKLKQALKWFFKTYPSSQLLL